MYNSCKVLKLHILKWHPIPCKFWLIVKTNYKYVWAEHSYNIFLSFCSLRSPMYNVVCTKRGRWLWFIIHGANSIFTRVYQHFNISYRWFKPRLEYTVLRMVLNVKLSGSGASLPAQADAGGDGCHFLCRRAATFPAPSRSCAPQGRSYVGFSECLCTHAKMKLSANTQISTL